MTTKERKAAISYKFNATRFDAETKKLNAMTDASDFADAMHGDLTPSKYTPAISDFTKELQVSRFFFANAAEPIFVQLVGRVQAVYGLNVAPSKKVTFSIVTSDATAVKIIKQMDKYVEKVYSKHAAFAKTLNISGVKIKDAVEKGKIERYGVFHIEAKIFNADQLVVEDAKATKLTGITWNDLGKNTRMAIVQARLEYSGLWFDLTTGHAKLCFKISSMKMLAPPSPLNEAEKKANAALDAAAKGRVTKRRLEERAKSKAFFDALFADDD